MMTITCPKSHVAVDFLAFDWVRLNQLVVWYGLHEWPAIVLRDMATRLNFSGMNWFGGRPWPSLYEHDLENSYMRTS